jgi:hypothetical protein
MQCIILVPGIEGSRLSLNGTEVWPPTWQEASGGYNRIAQLIDPNTVATGIFDQLALPFGLFYPVYKPLMNKLDEIAQELGARRVNFFYDWRSDIWTSAAEKLAQAIENSVANGATSVILVCHSMGSLVGRFVIESPKYKAAAWFKNISQLICICGPNIGAPIALGRALACEGSSLGLSAVDLQSIEDDPRYPAGYQCFPVPGKDTLYDVSTGTAVAMDIYNAAVDKTYDLTRSNVLAAQTSWNQLDIDKHPTAIDYIVIGGQGFDTSSSYLFNGTQFVQTITNDGDGTVPLWSAISGNNVTHYTMPGGHVDIMGTVQLKQLLDEIFRVTVTMSARLIEQAGITITINKHTFLPGETMQVIVIPDTPAGEIDGKLMLTFAPNTLPSGKDAPSALVPYGTGTSLTFKGPETSHLSTRLTAPRIPGAYILKFEGTHSSTDASSAVFFVNNASTISIHSRKVQKQNKRAPAQKAKAAAKAKAKKKT